MSHKNNEEIIYNKGIFILCVFAITWISAILMTKIDYNSHSILFTTLDFIESASPLIVTIILLRSYICKDKFLKKFIFGEPKGLITYLIVIALFTIQFLNFYLFKLSDTTISIKLFVITFLGQLLLGGGLEEAGWRGYLLPALHKKWSILPASLSVSAIWVIWHIPYFILPGNIHIGGDFIAYSVIGIITGVILTAIYLLTKSILLCTLFHSWQNTIVMTIQTDMQNPWFMVIFLFLGAVSVVLCLFIQKTQTSCDKI